MIPTFLQKGISLQTYYFCNLLLKLLYNSRSINMIVFRILVVKLANVSETL